MPGIKLTNLMQQLDDHLSWAHRSCLLFTVLLGFLLRWYSLYEGHGYIYFAINDEIDALRYAFGFMAGDPHMWYLGQPTLNQQALIPGPIWAMFLAALYKLGGSSVEGAIFLMVLLNTLVIYLVYLLASRLMPARYALLSALFYALSPWAIYYSAGIYNPMPLALLGVLLFLALWQTLNVEKSRAVFWVLVLAACIPQFHIIGIFYYPAILLLLACSPMRLNLRWLVAGAIAGALLYLPYLIGEILHDWSNLRAVLGGPPKFSFGILKILSIPIGMLTNHPGQWPGYSTAELIDFANRWFGSYLVLIFINLISLMLALFFVAGFIRKFYTSIRSSAFNLKTALVNHHQYIFIGVLLVLPLLIYILLGKAYATRYSIFIFPLLFLIPALYIAGIKNVGFKRIVLSALFLMFICNIYLVLVFYVDQNRKITTATQYMPAFYKLDALRTALQQHAGKDKSIVVDTTKYIQKGNKYSEIAGSAVSDYLNTYTKYQSKSSGLAKPQQYILVDSEGKVPAGAEVVYRDNGLFIYTSAPIVNK